ncbi:MAG: sigma-54 dependent transcriptional regulator [Candidatus Cloacimonadota bacterium]|nr:sigma-54 dependent transcriptional regulator [Candidatus Cloacimonadota bacterium]
MGKILILDDNKKLANFYSKILNEQNYEVEMSHNSNTFLEKHQQFCPDVVLLDILLPNSKLDGIAVLKKLKREENSCEVIIMSGAAKREQIAEAMKLGAFNFIEKTGEFSIGKFLSEINQAFKFHEQKLNNLKLQQEKENLRKQLISSKPFVGECDAIKRVKEKIKKFAKADVDVLVVGETGTGKEIVAHNLFWNSNKLGAPFIKRNAGEFTETLVNSELFGHKKGSFTGAYEDRKGCFELADGGVLFLDEISNLNMGTQAKILRAIENKEIRIVGGRIVKVDVRLFFASNKDLSKLVRNKKFRKDLYYRLEGNTIELPPLKDRGKDVTLLMRYFFEKLLEKYTDKIIDVDFRISQNSLLSYEWPGNVRELEKLCEYLFVMYDKIDNDVIANEINAKKRGSTASEIYEFEQLLELGDYNLAVNQFEKIYLKSHLEKNDFKITSLAQAIGLDRSTVYKKLKKYHIK